METFTVLKVECGRTFSSEVKLDEAGVARWASNGRVPPADAIRDYRIDRLPGFNASRTDASRTDAAREAETLAFLKRDLRDGEIHPRLAPGGKPRPHPHKA